DANQIRLLSAQPKFECTSRRIPKHWLKNGTKGLWAKLNARKHPFMNYCASLGQRANAWPRSVRSVYICQNAMPVTKQFKGRSAPQLLGSTPGTCGHRAYEDNLTTQSSLPP